MMDHMHMVKWIACVLEGNVREAKKYAMKAHELRNHHRMAADWCRDMAQSHLGFNSAGHTLFERTINEMDSSGEYAAMMPGVRAVYEDRIQDIMQDTAEIKAMIEMYK